MILFCDTSALIKLHLQEAYSQEMLQLAGTATAIAVCRIAWAEAMAALSRRAREMPADAAVIETCQEDFQSAWANYAIVEITQPLMQMAGELADAFALRAYDSVQLACARTLNQGTNEHLIFACFDKRLQKAAMMLEIESFGPD